MHAVSTDVAHKMHSARHVCGHCVYTHTYFWYRPHIIQCMRRHCTRCMDTVYALNAHTCASVRNIALHKNVC